MNVPSPLRTLCVDSVFLPEMFPENTLALPSYHQYHHNVEPGSKLVSDQVDLLAF